MMSTLIISNEEMINIVKIVKSPEDAIETIEIIVSETIENEVKEQKGGFLSMLLDILGSSLLGNLLTGKGLKWSNITGRGVMWADKRVISAGEETIRVGQDF